MRKIRDIKASVSPNSSPEKQSNGVFWEFKNSAENTDEATLYVYGDIVAYDLDDWNWPDDVVPNKFKDELKALGDVKKIHVRINSYGGSVFAAYAIMNMLKNHKSEIITYNDGICASAATIIAMAGNKIVTAVGAVWMLHLPLLFFYGYYNAEELGKNIDILNTITKSMIDIYNSKTKISAEGLEAMLKDETWLTGKEAFDMGLADEVTEVDVAAHISSDKTKACINGISFDVSSFKNVKNLSDKLPKEAQKANTKGSKPTEVPTQNNSQTNNENEEETIVDLNELKAKHPDIYNAAKQEGTNEGIISERNRIKEIEDMSLPGMSEIANKAKYTEPVDGATFAKNLILAQKAKGVNFLNSAKDDAKDLNKVPSSPAPSSSENDKIEEENLLKTAANIASAMR